MQRTGTNDTLRVLHIAAERLAEAGIPYMLTGSLAMNFYAEPRMTRDVDIVIDVTPERAADLVALFAKDFYVTDEAVREALVRRSMFNIIHTVLTHKVDLIVSKSTEYGRIAMERRRRVTMAGREIGIISPEDLILSKLSWAKASQSEVQLGDVRNLLNSLSDLDMSYLEEWLAKLNLGGIWEQVRT